MNEQQFEALHIFLNNDMLYKELVKGGVPQASEVTVVTKKHCTVGGLPGAVIHFMAVVDNVQVPVQATVTVRNILALCKVLQAAYPDLTDKGMVMLADLPPGSQEGN